MLICHSVEITKFSPFFDQNSVLITFLLLILDETKLFVSPHCMAAQAEYMIEKKGAKFLWKLNQVVYNHTKPFVAMRKTFV